ncbi:PP2C family protein-serine/threonine phosphatase [Arsenicicoccus dermatophilus]|uniref:PP2C family protein-serine/threonine phosphatase n=1 Tax=Arsenicicoccus dermatophilus TaxID=1076331 RepID=UPI001F4CF57B|nr:protein phosphatase 2C domain-containing protein [Arsenicicoccus dermatophilus]MCH8612422.1 protein phosphatase 2C domain-containing protein [Arsenicicoccus dermatophilus]
MTTSARLAALSDRGRVSDHNEDCYATHDDLWIVADGMGGHASGEVASRVAVDSVVRSLGAMAPGQALADQLRDAVAGARGALLDHVRATPQDAGMGTTLVTAARRGDELAVAWVGDSRAYLLEGDQLRSLTNDHNVAEEMLALGMIDAEQARTHPGQYRLTRALSGDSDIDATPDALTVPARGRLLLCSDGLNGELSSDTIGRLLGEADPETAARALVHAALDAGGRDNITVVVVDL